MKQALEASLGLCGGDSIHSLAGPVLPTVSVQEEGEAETIRLASALAASAATANSSGAGSNTPAWMEEAQLSVAIAASMADDSLHRFSPPPQSQAVADSE